MSVSSLMRFSRSPSFAPRNNRVYDLFRSEVLKALNFNSHQDKVEISTFHEAMQEHYDKLQQDLQYYYAKRSAQTKFIASGKIAELTERLQTFGVGLDFSKAPAPKSEQEFLELIDKSLTIVKSNIQKERDKSIEIEQKIEELKANI
jgi:hypothetical protein